MFQDLDVELWEAKDPDWASSMVVYVVHYWVVQVGSALLFTTFWAPPLLRGFRIIQRIRGGRCAACGYDLRATSARCPECGTVPAGGMKA